MQIRTLNVDKMIRDRNMKEVTSHRISGPGSLFDPDIFGERGDTKDIFAYIDLKGNYLNPNIVNISARIFREINSIIDGSKKFIIEDGRLVSDPNGETGIKWFYDNFHKIQFKKIRDSLDTGNNRMQSKLMKKSYLKLQKHDFFISKVVVLPLKYRDINTQQENIHLDELNQLYIDLIKLVETKQTFGSTDSIVIDKRIQNKIMEINDYFQSKTFKKTGAQRRLSLSRSVDNSSRTVIVSPEIKISDTIGRGKHQLDKFNVPLHHLVNMTTVQVLSSMKTILNRLHTAGLIDASESEFHYHYTNNELKEIIEMYHNAQVLRLSPVLQPNGEPIKVYTEWTGYKDKKVEGERLFTKLDLLALAIKPALSKVGLFSTRFPVTNKGSIPPGIPQPLYANYEEGVCKFYADKDKTEYIDVLDNYPNVEGMLAMDKAEAASLFNEATVFSNLYLDGINGDYDGDTMSHNPIYSEEGRKEIKDYLKSPIAHLNVDGSNTRTLGNECIQGLWNLTTDKHSDKIKLKKTINEAELKKILNQDFYTLETIIKLLDEYHPEMRIRWKGENTTLGRVIFNEVVFNHVPFHKFINETLTKNKIHDIFDKYAAYLIDDKYTDKFTVDMYKDILDKTHDLGFGICDVIASSLDYNMLVKYDPKFNEAKARIMKDIDEVIKNNDGIRLAEMEKEMIKFAKEYYKDNQMSDLYDSGAKPKWDGDFKAIKVGLGIVPLPGTGDYKIIKSNLKEGIENKDIVPNANLQIYGAYNRAVLTQKGGYLTKKLYNAFQSTVAYEGDCGTKRYLKVNKSNRKDLLFRYVKTDKGDVLIDSDNIEQFLNKDIELRSPIFCKHPKGFCTKCTGELIHRVYGKSKSSDLNIGLYISNIGSDIMNKFLKKTHSLSPKLFTIDDLNDFLK